MKMHPLRQTNKTVTLLTMNCLVPKVATWNLSTKKVDNPKNMYVLYPTQQRSIFGMGHLLVVDVVFHSPKEAMVCDFHIQSFFFLFLSDDDYLFAILKIRNAFIHSTIVYVGKIILQIQYTALFISQVIFQPNQDCVFF